MSEPRDPVTALNEGFAEAAADVRRVMEEMTKAAPRPLIGEPRSKPEERNYYRELLATPERVGLLNAQDQQRFGLKAGRRVSRRLVQELERAWADLQREDKRNGLR